jgi:hypothetical protein
MAGPLLKLNISMPSTKAHFPEKPPPLQVPLAAKVAGKLGYEALQPQLKRTVQVPGILAILFLL